MRIVYATDVHGAWKSVKALLEQTSADLYIIGGDLLKKSFRSYKHFFRFNELQHYFNFLKCRFRSEIDTRSFVEGRLYDEEWTHEERRKATEYLKLHRLAHKTILEDLADLESIFSAFPEKKIYVLPGNYDIDLRQTALRHRDLHKAVVAVNGIRIAGYGGANIMTPGMPEDLMVRYREFQSGGSLYSEPRDFLSQERPDLVVLHIPPFGYFDMLRSYGHVGSVGVRDYVDQYSPAVLLCGHFHENWGLVQKGNTVLINPSNLGRVLDTQGLKRGGYFFDFILEGTSFRIGTLRQLDKGKVYDLADYRRDSNKSINQIVIDPDRIRILSRERALTGPVLQQVRDFNKVRNFFRHYETPETRQRIRDLRKVYRDLRERGVVVAFDVLGSVNFGMSEASSDVDLVIYRRCPCTQAFAETSCSLPKGLWECFKGLEDRYHVEVTDCVNINQVEASIHAEDPHGPALQRFVLYRSICRPINLRMIRETESLLHEKKGLKRKVEYLLKDYFKEIVLTHSHIYSFKKYEVRLHDQGVNLPPTIMNKLSSYLGMNN